MSAQASGPSRNDHPGMGAFCQYLGRGRQDVPGYVCMPTFPGSTATLRCC